MVDVYDKNEVLPQDFASSLCCGQFFEISMALCQILNKN